MSLRRTASRKRRAARGSIVADGNQSATFVVIPLPRARVQALLPTALKLVPCDLAGAGKHPLVCAFGAQRNVRTKLPLLHSVDPRELAAFFASLPKHQLLPIAMDYLEVTAAIPFVTWARPHDTCPGPFVYAPRLYLNQPVAIFLGWLAGLAKEYAWMNGDETDLDATGLDLRLRFTGSARPRGRVGAPADFPNFANIRPMLELPVIGQILKGPLVRSRFVFGLDEAKVQAASAKVRLTKRFFGGVQAEISYSAGGIDEEALGAFCMDVPWEGSDPMICLPT